MEETTVSYLDVIIDGETTRFAPADTVTIGRDAGSSVVVANAGGSRTHATVQYRAGTGVLTDHSTGGTFAEHGQVRELTVDGLRWVRLGSATGPAVHLRVPESAPEMSPVAGPTPPHALHAEDSRRSAPALASLLPVKQWAHKREWRRLPVLAFLALGVAPFLVFTMTDGNDSPMDTAAWAFAGMTALLCAGAA